MKQRKGSQDCTLIKPISLNQLNQINLIQEMKLTEFKTLNSLIEFHGLIGLMMADGLRL